MEKSKGDVAQFIQGQKDAKSGLMPSMNNRDYVAGYNLNMLVKGIMNERSSKT